MLERLGSGAGVTSHQDYGGVLREDGFSFAAAEFDVSVGHSGQGCLGTVGSVGLRPSFLPSRPCASQGVSEVIDLKVWSVNVKSTGQERAGS